MRHIWAGVVSAVLVLTVPVGLQASAATDRTKTVRSVEISTDTATVRVGQTRTLTAYVLPATAEDQEVYWDISDDEIVAVDGDGILTGVSPGTATVTATSADGKRRATCVVTVPAAAVAGLATDGEEDASSTAALSGGERLHAATLRADVERALQTAANSPAKVTYQGKSKVSAAALRAADYAAREANGTVELRFDTLFAQGGIQGRLTVNPALYGDSEGDIRLGVTTQSAYINTLRQTLQASGYGDAAIVHCEQSGSYGMMVEIAAKVDESKPDTGSLTLWAYDPATGGMTPVEAALRVDANSYVHFATDVGGVYILA
ncbi:Ig-like domain-containing protein [Ruminococcaceae bacterium OttesenSCG-928-L11]|nr:Ig-like domain-containing protein [Ruminococcaceae bacterium OttesenSCG-928-L11]